MGKSDPYALNDSDCSMLTPSYRKMNSHTTGRNNEWHIMGHYLDLCLSYD